MHARQKSDRVPINKVHHTNDTFSDLLLGAVSAGVIDSFGKVLDEADPLRYPDLLLLRQLRGQASLARRGVIHRNRHLLLIWRRRLLIRLSPVSVAGSVRLGLVEQRDVIRGGGLEAVPHLPGGSAAPPPPPPAPAADPRPQPPRRSAQPAAAPPGRLMPAPALSGLAAAAAAQPPPAPLRSRPDPQAGGGGRTGLPPPVGQRAPVGPPDRKSVV